MKATRILLAAMVLGTTIGASQANAQGCSSNSGSCSATNTASVNVGALVKLTMSSATTVLTDPTANDVDLGNTIADVGPTFSIKANRSWTLKIKAGVGPSWSYVGSDAGVKPIGDLSWATSAGGSYTAITTTDATFTSSASASNGLAAAAFFKTSWLNDFSSASNAPGAYSLPIVFTLTAP